MKEDLVSLYINLVKLEEQMKDIILDIHTTLNAIEQCESVLDSEKE